MQAATYRHRPSAAKALRHDLLNTMRDLLRARIVDSEAVTDGVGHPPASPQVGAFPRVNQESVFLEPVYGHSIYEPSQP